MRLTELVESKTVIKEAAPALIALPIIGAVSPTTAGLIASALGLSALYTGDQLSKIEIESPEAFKNFTNTISSPRFRAIGNPFIAAMLLTQQLVDNPDKFNDATSVKDMANAASEQSLKTDVSSRPEVTASGGHLKRNQINAQRAWDAAYGQTHLHTGEVNKDAGKIDPALVRATVAATSQGPTTRQGPRGAKAAAAPTAMTTAPEISAQVDAAADKMNADIAAGKDPSAIAKDFVSTLKSEISPEDVPDVSTSSTTKSDAQTTAPAAPSSSGSDTAPSVKQKDDALPTARTAPKAIVSPRTTDAPADIAEPAPDVKTDAPVMPVPGENDVDLGLDIPQTIDKPVSKAAQPPALAIPKADADPLSDIDFNPPKSDAPIASTPPAAVAAPVNTKTPANIGALGGLAALKGVQTGTKAITKGRAGKKPTKTTKGKLPGLPGLGGGKAQDPGRMMQFSPIDIKDPLSLKSTRSTYAPY